MEGHRDSWDSCGLTKMISSAAAAAALVAVCENALAIPRNYCQLCECHCQGRREDGDDSADRESVSSNPAV